MTLLAVTSTDILVTLHILAVVVTFGGALAYPLWFRMIRGGTPQQRAFFSPGAGGSRQIPNGGTRLTASQIRRALLRPPPGMPSYGDLPAGELNALVSYLAGLR